MSSQDLNRTDENALPTRGAHKVHAFNSSWYGSNSSGAFAETSSCQAVAGEDEMTILRHSLIIDPKKQFTTNATVSWEKLGHGLWKGTSSKIERVPGLRTISNVQFFFVIDLILRQ